VTQSRSGRVPSRERRRSSAQQVLRPAPLARLFAGIQEPLARALERAKYIYVTTYSRTGRPGTVPTWLWLHGGAVYFTTQRQSLKARRIRDNGRVTVHVGTKEGPAFEGRAEWVEDRAAALQANAVAYVNLDSSVTGHDLDVDGIPSLRDLVVEIAGDLAEPRSGGSVLDAWRSRKHVDWAKNEPLCAAEEGERFELYLNPLGSGSDYTAFVDHAGVASLNFSFEGDYGVYHSVYDDLFWMEKFGDPEFLYHALASRLYGLLAMRLAAAEVVPLRYAHYGRALGRELELLRRESLRERRAHEAATGEAAPAAPGSIASVEARKRPALVPDFAPLARAIAAFTEAGGALDGALLRLEESPRGAGDPATLARLNDALVQVERAFLDPQGLPGRPWFRHLLYAPGLTTGYASWPFPGVVQALKEREPRMLERQMTSLLDRIAAGTGRVTAARALAERIVALVEDGALAFTRKDSERRGAPLNYGDVAVLFRSTISMRFYERELAARQVPYFVQKGRGYFQTQEVRDLMNLIRVLDNPRDEVSLAAVLRSPICGLTDDDLYRLCRTEAKQQRAKLADRIEVDGIDLSESGRERLKTFRELLDPLRSRKGQGPLWVGR